MFNLPAVKRRIPFTRKSAPRLAGPPSAIFKVKLPIVLADDRKLMSPDVAEATSTVRSEADVEEINPAFKEQYRP